MDTGIPSIKSFFGQTGPGQANDLANQGTASHSKPHVKPQPTLAAGDQTPTTNRKIFTIQPITGSTFPQQQTRQVKCPRCSQRGHLRYDGQANGHPRWKCNQSKGGCGGTTGLSYMNKSLETLTPSLEDPGCHPEQGDSNIPQTMPCVVA